MIAGADEPATLSGLCQPMAIAMVSKLGLSIHGKGWCEGDVRRSEDPGRRPFQAMNEAPVGERRERGDSKRMQNGDFGRLAVRCRR